MSRQSRRFTFTVNNYKNQILGLPTALNYICYGCEVAPTTLTPHIQGYCEFHKKITGTSAKTYVDTLFGNGCYIVCSNGSHLQNKAYTSKENLTEYGEPMVQGKRNDIHAFLTAVKDGTPKRELWDEHIEVMARYPYLYDIVKADLVPERREPPIVRLYWGETGTGKSRTARELEGIEQVSYDGKFYSSAPQMALIEELAPNQWSREAFLALTDRYPLRVPIKGGWATWQPTVIIFTSNYSPMQLFREDPAIMRRVECIEFKANA